MNTHDKYELPPLFLPGAIGKYTKKEMQEYAREAIEPYAKRIVELEADRKRRGEPVGIVKRPSESHYPGVQWIGDVRDGEHLYTSPQPAALSRHPDVHDNNSVLVGFADDAQPAATGANDLAKAIEEMFLEETAGETTDLALLVSPSYVNHLQEQGVPMPEGAKVAAGVSASRSAEPVKVPSDQFNGDDAALVRNIHALLDLDSKGVLVPHGIGGHARTLLSAAASRLGQPAQPAETVRLLCRKCGEKTSVSISSARLVTHFPNGMPRDARDIASDPEGKLIHEVDQDLAGYKKAPPISDVMMDLADRLGSEYDKVDPRAWEHLLVYAPKPILAQPAESAGQ